MYDTYACMHACKQKLYHNVFATAHTFPTNLARMKNVPLSVTKFSIQDKQRVLPIGGHRIIAIIITSAYYYHSIGASDSDMCNTITIDPHMNSISHYLGLNACANPKTTDPNWDAVEKLIEYDPQSAKLQCGRCGIFYPLDLAICNEVSPVPPRIVEKLILAYPDVLTDNSFELACSNQNLHLDVFKVMLWHDRSLLSPWSLRKVAISNNTRVAKYIICNYPDVLPRTCGDWALIYGNTIQVFWLRMMLVSGEISAVGVDIVSEEHIEKMKLLHYFTSQSNLAAVKMLVERYPDTLSSASKMGMLPIHEALSNYSGRVYGWNAELVQYLLDEGSRNKVGGRDGGFGGLFVPNDAGTTPLASSIGLIRDLLFSYDWGERWDCLMVCIRFLDREFGGGENNSMFHAALNTIPFAVDVMDLIVERYGVEPSASDMRVKNPIHIAIEAMARMTITPLSSFVKMNSVDRNTRDIFQRLLGGSYEGTGLHLAREKDENGCIPLVRAAVWGIPWSGGLSDILEANIAALEERDPRTGLYPFMITALGNKGCPDLNVTYEMLKRYIGPLLDSCDH